MSDKQQLIGSNKQYEYPEQDPNYEGNQLDERLKQGPLEDRGCNDVFCCILYLAMIGGLVAVSIFAFNNGDPNRLLQPYDNNSVQCGFGSAQDYPNVYIISSTSFFCVKSCPTATADTIDCLPSEGTCPSATYSSYRLLTVCYPTSAETAAISLIDSIITIGNFQELIADLKNTWTAQLATAFIALIMSLLVTVLIRYFAACLVWIVIVLYFVGLTLLGVFCYETATNPEWQTIKTTDTGLLKGIAYTAWSIDVLSLLIFFCIFKKITLAIAVMKAAADFTRQVCEAAFVPLVLFITMLGMFCYCVAVSVFLMSCGKVTQTITSPFPPVSFNSGLGWMLFYDLFALYWNCNFAMAFCQFVISSACCMWYFSHLGADLRHPISKSIFRGLLHHSGSLAFGALILTFVGIIRFFLDQIHKALKESVMNNHGVSEGCTKCWFACCNCCLKYFEKFIRYLNQNAYIMIALTGQSFCSAAYDAFYLLARNVVKVAVTHGLGEIFSLLGNLFIGITSTMLGYVIITQIDYYSDNIISPVLPTCGFLIISLVIGSLFMNVYGMAVDSILLCYIADSELHRHEGGAKSVPSSLQEFLGEYK